MQASRVSSLLRRNPINPDRSLDGPFLHLTSVIRGALLALQSAREWLLHPAKCQRYFITSRTPHSGPENAACFRDYSAATELENPRGALAVSRDRANPRHSGKTEIACRCHTHHAIPRIPGSDHLCCSMPHTQQLELAEVDAATRTRNMAAIPQSTNYCVHRVTGYQ